MGRGPRPNPRPEMFPGGARRQSERRQRREPDEAGGAQAGGRALTLLALTVVPKPHVLAEPQGGSDPKEGLLQAQPRAPNNPKGQKLPRVRGEPARAGTSPVSPQTSPSGHDGDKAGGDGSEH